jgi:hypothetical protein
MIMQWPHKRMGMILVEEWLREMDNVNVRNSMDRMQKKVVPIAYAVDVQSGELTGILMDHPTIIVPDWWLAEAERQWQNEKESGAQ